MYGRIHNSNNKDNKTFNLKLDDYWWVAWRGRHAWPCQATVYLCLTRDSELSNQNFCVLWYKGPITERNTSYLIHQSSLLVSLFNNTTERTLLHQSCRWRLVICAFTYSYCFPLLLNYPELHAMKRRHLEVRQNRSLFFFSDLRESRLNFFFFFFFNTREPSLVLITAKQYEKQKSYTFHYITNNQVSEGVVKHIYREGWEVRSL